MKWGNDVNLPKKVVVNYVRVEGYAVGEIEDRPCTACSRAARRSICLNLK